MKRVSRIRVIVSGTVQGVSYRAACRGEASARGVGGWVRNRGDGSVEAVFEGPAEDVDAMLRWARTGPPAASVAGLEVYPETPAGIRGFTIEL